MSERKYILFTVGGFLLVLLLGGGALVWPAYREASSLRFQAADLYSRMANLEELTAEVQRLEAELDGSQRYAMERLKIIPEGPDVADLIRRLALRFDGESVLDQTFTAGSPNPAIPGEEGAQAMPITIDMQARFDSVFAVIRATELMSRLVRVTSLRLNCNRTANAAGSYDDPVLTASVIIDAIYEPSAPPVGGVTGGRRTERAAVGGDRR